MAAYWMFSDDGQVYVLDGSIVATIGHCAGEYTWVAHGCLEDWQDTNLGVFLLKRQAQQAVETWVSEEDARN